MRCCDLLYRQLVSVYGGDVVHSHLTSDNATLLRQLSPQGVAKLNSDASKGVPLECTLLELKAAYVRRSRRVDMLRCSLPDSTQRLLATELHPNRPLTVNELLLVVGGIPTRRLLADVHKLTKQGNSTEDALEHLAVTHELSSRRKKQGVVHNLVPTALYTESQNQAADKPKAKVPNPTECWFLDDPQNAPLGGSCDFPQVMLPTTLSTAITILEATPPPSPTAATATTTGDTSCKAVDTHGSRSLLSSPFQTPIKNHLTSSSSSSSSNSNSVSLVSSSSNGCSDCSSGDSSHATASPEVGPVAGMQSSALGDSTSGATATATPLAAARKAVRFMESAEVSATRSKQPPHRHHPGKKAKKSWRKKAARWFKSLSRYI